MSGLSEAAIAEIIARKTAAPTPTGFCAAGCGERLDPALIQHPSGLGLHPTCVIPEPPSTVMELRQVLINYEAARPRSRQVRLGPSELGTPCDARLVRKLAGAPSPPPTSPAWAPLQGTAMHAEMEKVVAFWNQQLGWPRWTPERRLDIAPGLSGHGDAFDDDSGTVVDWKLVGVTAIKKLRQARRAGAPVHMQVSPEYRTQAHLYGRGHRNAGSDVRWVRLVLLFRGADYDDSDEWTEAYDDDLAQAAIDRHQELISMTAELDLSQHPEQITMVATSPGEACRWCPYHQPLAPTSWASCAGNVTAVRRFGEGLL